MKLLLFTVLFACRAAAQEVPAGEYRPSPPGPLVSVPAHWTHQQDLCMHAVCGTYRDSRTGVELSYRSSDPEVTASDECDPPPVAQPFAGEVQGHAYSGFHVPDARSWEVSEIARLVPDLLQHLDDPSRVVLSPPGTSAIVICFDLGHCTWRFSASICHEAEAESIRNLLLSTYRLADAPDTPGQPSAAGSNPGMQRTRYARR